MKVKRVNFRKGSTGSDVAGGVGGGINDINDPPLPSRQVPPLALLTDRSVALGWDCLIVVHQAYTV
jgi:hypothetical protein